MTIGQRIAQKRKELGLSQESLGEQLGVSRQAIYKWESDATLPEIEKLIALSRCFEVSVGWLLGVEETPDGNSNSGSSELTETQMQMVKEIVDGYLTAQPKPEPPKRRRWPKVLGFIACIALVVVLTNLFNRLDNLNSQYSSLHNSIGHIQNNVSVQINSIAGRVEEILKSQNDLTSDYSTAFVGVIDNGTMGTFTWRARPKTYEEGMVAWIDIENNGARITYGPYDPIREVFSGEFTVALTDSTAIYIVFEHNGIRQTQLLDTYERLYSSSFPLCWLDARPLFFDVDDNTNLLTDDLYADLTRHDEEYPRTQVKSYRIGLFADQTLVTWFTPITREIILNGQPAQEETHKLSREENIIFDRSKLYCVAAVVTDEFGREFIIADIPLHWTDSGWSNVSTYNSGPFFEGWTY